MLSTKHHPGKAYLLKGCEQHHPLFAAKPECVGNPPYVEFALPEDNARVAFASSIIFDYKQQHDVVVSR